MWLGRETTGVGGGGSEAPLAVPRWFAVLVQQHGICVLVADDLFSDKVVAEKLQLRHQICQFHIRRWLRQTLRQLHRSPRAAMGRGRNRTTPGNLVARSEQTLVRPLGTAAGAVFQTPAQTHTSGTTARIVFLRLSERWLSDCTYPSDSNLLLGLTTPPSAPSYA